MSNDTNQHQWNQFVDHGDSWQKAFVRVFLQNEGGYVQVQYKASDKNKMIEFADMESLEGVLVYLKKFSL